VESRITFQGRDREIEGYLALPDGGGEGLPGVVVIHEIWGLDEHIGSVARRFAAEGYAALAPDLYTGEWREVMSNERITAGMAFLRNASQEVQRDPDKLESVLADKPQEERDATKMLATVMSPEGRLRFAVDLLGAIDYLKGRSEVDAGRIGSVGFCMGGAISGLLATLSPELRVAVIFYGQNPPPRAHPGDRGPRTRPLRRRRPPYHRRRAGACRGDGGGGQELRAPRLSRSPACLLQRHSA